MLTLERNPEKSDRKTEIKNTVAEQVRAIRERRQRERRGGFTQQDVADQLSEARGVSISRVGYSKYETGENEIAVSDLPLLAEIFGVPVEYFYGLDTPDQYQDDEFTAWYHRLPTGEKMTLQALKEAMERRRLDEQDETVYGSTHGKKAE